MSDDLCIVRDGDIGRITLDRPAALNALTTPMIDGIADALDEWEGSIRAVILDSTHPKVFCAGGDIRAIRQHTLEGEYERSGEFFSKEYRLNERIADYSAPIISIVDGVCMGGGMGLAIHGSVRIVTERTVMAMPETAIGFFPDVGASHFLSRLPGALGMYWGMTGARISPGDAMHSGLGTHFVPALTGDDLVRALVERPDAEPEECVALLAEQAPASEAASRRGLIDEAFGAGSVDEILDLLARSGSPWAGETRDTLESLSRQSLDITHALLTWAEGRSLHDCLRTELTLSAEVTRTADFVEGVRAVLVDKDRKPRWEPSGFLGLTPEGRTLWNE